MYKYTSPGLCWQQSCVVDFSRCSKLPARLQEYVMPDKKTHKDKAPAGHQAQRTAASSRAPTKPTNSSILLQSEPHSSSSVRKLTIKLSGSGSAHRHACLAQPMRKQPMPVKVTQCITRTPGTEVYLTNNCSEPLADFALGSDGILRHQYSGLCVGSTPQPLPQPLPHHHQRAVHNMLQLALMLMLGGMCPEQTKSWTCDAIV